MIDVYRKILELFDARERRQFYLMMGLMVVVAFAEIVGISTVFLLLGVLARPEAITEGGALLRVYETFGFQSPYAFQVFLSIAVFGVVMASLALRALASYTVIRFSTMRGYTISARLLAAYLHRPYGWFLGHNSAEIRKSVLNEVDQLVARSIVPAMKFLAGVILALSVVGFLLYVDPVVCLVAAGLLGGSYGAIYFMLRKRLKSQGAELLAVNGQRFRVVQEATGGIKELKLMGLEDAYLRRFQMLARRRARVASKMQLLGELPRYFLQGLTFAVLLSLIMILLFRSGGELVAIIPTLGVFAFAVMRLLPALQQVYSSLTAIRSSGAVLENIHRNMVFPATADAGAIRVMGNVPVLRLENELEFTGVSYSYAAAERPALENLDLRVAARSTIGIVGGSGAGKTTLVDIILGLLPPQSGEIRVDGVALGPENLRAWQKSLGYVPQSIFLTDDTVAANIAFGVRREDIDLAAVERAARMAALHGFVTSELPKGYDTFVGERGVRLSGGQRQRIGIARALYANPSLIVMDEATSALDNITERIVLEAIENIRSDKTIILIAHRLTTVRRCDVIYVMEKGHIVGAGTYDDLAAGNEMFRRMVASA